MLFFRKSESPKKPIDVEEIADKIMSGGTNAGEKFGGLLNMIGKKGFIIGGTIFVAVLFGVGLFISSFFRSIAKK